MTGPIVFISHNRIRPGGLAGLGELGEGVFRQIEADRPGTVVFLGYLSPDQTRVTFIHLFPDSEAFARHVEGSDERSAAAQRFMEPTSIEIYGAASEAVIDVFRPLADAGIPVTIEPELFGGFARLHPGA